MLYEDYRAQNMAAHDELLRYWLHADLKEHGENRLGIEFKFDHKFRQTKNLYIEIAEKARPRDGDYAPAGVNRQDNTWLWVQGDQLGVWVFMKSRLRRACKSGDLRKVYTATSVGVLLPVAKANKIAVTTVKSPGGSFVVRGQGKGVAA